MTHTGIRGTEMGDSLSDLFAVQKTTKVEWGGPLFSLYELPTDASHLVVRFVSARPDPPQGVRLKIRGGDLEVEGTRGRDLVFWEDSAPEEVRVSIVWKPRAARSLRIWNIWRGGCEVIQAWLGNAGMRVDDDGRRLLLRCSDGRGEPNFGDLVVEVVLT